jgi:hypothetical protein
MGPPARFIQRTSRERRNEVVGARRFASGESGAPSTPSPGDRRMVAPRPSLRRHLGTAFSLEAKGGRLVAHLPDGGSSRLAG